MNQKLSEYLSYFLKQKEAGLVIIKDENQISDAQDRIKLNGLALAKDWREVINKFRSNQSVCLELTADFSKETYDLIAQYSARSSAIQIMDRNSMKLNSIQFDPFKSHLLLIATEENLAKIEKNYSIKDRVGLVERI